VPIRPLQLCDDGGYQPSLGVLGVPLIKVPDIYIYCLYSCTEWLLVPWCAVSSDLVRSEHCAVTWWLVPSVVG
jgi:hypothetical protein